MQQSIPAADIEAIRAALLAFFDASARALPWRQTRDPYAIWVSEVMSQQTRVETAVPYYERWLERFPTLAALAEAPADDVLKAWEGLGYYSRARNLHSAARLVRERHGGMIPHSWDALRALPGVGDYTAGAVSSIAFGAQRPAVDGNVRRVLARLLDHPAPPRAVLNDAAGALVPPDRPGDFNQALMELGATICTPRAPRCGRCPIASPCAARTAGTQEERPLPKVRKAVPVSDVATAVVRAPDRRLLIVRRPPSGLLAGMWCFPGVELQPDDDPALRALEIAHMHMHREVAASHCDIPSAHPDAGGSRRHIAASQRNVAPRPLGTIEHVFSHRRERYHCFLIEATAAAAHGDGVAWIGDTDSNRALPRAQQRIRAMAMAECDVQRATCDARHEGDRDERL